MSQSVANWYVITGGPSSGKTAVIDELAKLGYITIPETARVLIDKEINKGKTIKEIRGDETEFQRKVLKMKIKIEGNLPKDEIIFFDRAIPDSIAYLKICGLKRGEIEEIIKLCQERKYRKIFFLEQLPLEKDYARTEDIETINELNKLLKESYEKLGYEIIDIPVMPIKERVRRILVEIKKN